MFIRIIVTIAIAILSGFVFNYIRMPLPWMLGPIAGMIIWSSIFKGNPCWSPKCRNAGLIVVGYLIGRPFTPDTAHQIITQFPEMLLITLLAMLFTFALSYFTHKKTGINMTTCVISSIPGGLSQMVVLAEEIPSVDVAIVTFIHTIRILIVVFSVPFLVVHFVAKNIASNTASALQSASVSEITPEIVLPFAIAIIIGTWLAVRFKLPTPYLMGPTLATALLVLSGLPAPVLPKIIIIVAQICIGIYMGTNIKFTRMQNQLNKVAPYALLNAIVLVIFCLGLGWLLTFFIGADLVTGFLSTSPGGVAEMSLTALMVNADLSTIAVYQIFRIFFILLVMPFVLRRWLKHKKETEKRTCETENDL